MVFICIFNNLDENDPLKNSIQKKAASQSIIYLFNQLLGILGFFFA
jgi:hypothetical protein